MPMAGGNNHLRLALCVVLAWGLPPAANAQEGDEHAAHHSGTPSAAMALGNSMGGSASTEGGASASGMGSMASNVMDEEGEGEGEHEHHSSKGSPFISQLLAFPSLDGKARQKLGVLADDRVHRGLEMIGDASAEGSHAATPAGRLEAARRLNEGRALLQSGAAAQSALAGNGAPQDIAISWFRDHLDIVPEVPGNTAWLGLSPSHLLLMLFLGLVSATLVALQLFRMSRIRQIVGTAPIKTARTPQIPSGEALPKLADAIGSRPELAPSNAASPAGASLRKPKTWTGRLRVAQIVRETPTVLTFRLADPAGDRLPFDFLPGQFLQVEVEPDPGKPVRRSYTIASSPTQRAFVELTIKREEQGAVSRHLHDEIAAGDLLKVTGPFGAFTFTGTDADSIVLIAGGVGITPMMSVLRYLTDTAWAGEIYFLYGARSTEEFVFREEFERLERRFPNLHVIATMQRSPGTVWLGLEGPFTKEILSGAVPEIAKRRIHLCGPPGMMTAMKKHLEDLGVPEAQLHTEAFGPASIPVDPGAIETKTASTPNEAAPVPVSAAPTRTGAAVAETTITFSVSGVSAALPADQTVLEAAEGAGVEIPYSCRSGECGVCVTKLIDGEVTMAVETGLAPSDKAEGYILACQAKSTGKPLVVEA
jgi:ferredoxin-NADP reductase